MSIDTILFTAFLSVNLIIGLLAGRRVKSLRDFSIGNKDFSTATLTSTVVATSVGGGFLFYALQNIYTSGLQFILVTAGGTICLLLIGQVLSVRMGEFLNNLSVAESMGDLYGPAVRIITAISGILRAIGAIALQFQVIAKMLTLLLGLQGPSVTIAAASIVILYSAFGGIRSVLITDLFQFIAFVIFIPILALIVWNHVKNPSQVLHTITTNPIFSFKALLSWNPKLLSALALMLYFIIPGMNPPIFQRIAMAKTIEQIKSSFTYAAGITLIMIISVAWIAILLLADNPNLEPSGLVNHLINQYAYPGLKGLIAIGITAMAMSTADSDLNAAAVLAVNDIIKPRKSDWVESITITRLLSLGLGLCALALAIHTTDLLELLLLSGSFYMPIVTVPLLLAIFGFRSSNRAVLIGMTAGFITVVGWNVFLAHTDISSLMPGMMANLLFYMISHYVLQEKGGWVGIKEKGPLLAARQSRWESWRRFVYTIKHPHTYTYLQKNLPTYEVVYTLFAIYVIGATYASFFTIPEAIVTHHQKLYDFAVHSVLIATAGFLTYPAWPPTFKAKWFIAFAWPIGIFYILFVVGTILVLMSGFHQVQVMIFMLNLVMAAFLLSWPLMLLLSTAGMAIGSVVLYLYCGNLHCSDVDLAGEFKVVYGILLLSSFLIAIFRFKENKKKLESKNIYLARLYEEKSNELAEILGYREQIIKELSEDEKRLFDDTTAAYIQQIIYRMTDYMRLEVTTINLDQLLLEVKDILKLKELDNMTQWITKRLTKEESIHGDAAKLKQLLVNAILYIQEHNLSNQPITVIVEDAKLGHRVDYIKDYTRQLAALKFTITIEKDIPTKKDLYMIDQLPLLSQHTRKGKLIENARIIHAHYGYANLDNEHMQVYVLPANVREVRGKVMELLREPVEVDGEEVRHPLAIELEKELMDKIKGKKIDGKVINKALDTIKRYHAGIKRKSGEPFFTHPIAVALILLEYCQDQDAVVAALLHDKVEDTSLSLIQIRAIFGEKVAFIVSKVTNLEDNLRRVSSVDHENVYRLMNYEDERAAFVKLADRLHNMRTISGHSSLAKQKHIANETLNFFVPLAKNLGLETIARELEKLSLAVLGKR
ncbi:metal-dependent phosphohydrolase HD sub domain [Candidatus Amoebophilus asiaticus 5a2]|uniref:Metal-dependent phosphohydrolase HD sub domain n=1 Tax=Amoebophilus asiaticus (strain 5a2) TaxID=452471 RepID=B3EU76_AMOA5|nr:sodium:solute symporter family protein [Candidatus Amoebophilus asiaticus]ACE05495.1 metal-dependent phosphohydrolase HD sub domain [Candidatus Amoebophilus asiaticus 5a2]